MSKYTIETIKSGRMQFNAKDAKDFRAKMAKWHNADFELADEILQKNERVNAERTLIKSNDRLIEKIKNGQNVIGHKTVESIQAENVEHQKKIDKMNEEIAEYRKTQATRYADAHALLSKDLWKAYSEYAEDMLNADLKNAYIVALADFFDANGVEPAMESLTLFVSAVGKKKNSARQKCKTGKHNGSYGYNAWRDIFLGEICDVLIEQKAIDTHKFAYVLKENRKKDA